MYRSPPHESVQMGGWERICHWIWQIFWSTRKLPVSCGLKYQGNGPLWIGQRKIRQLFVFVGSHLQRGTRVVHITYSKRLYCLSQCWLTFVWLNCWTESYKSQRLCSLLLQLQSIYAVYIFDPSQYLSLSDTPHRYMCIYPHIYHVYICHVYIDPYNVVYYMFIYQRESRDWLYISMPHQHPSQYPSHSYICIHTYIDPYCILHIPMRVKGLTVCRTWWSWATRLRTRFSRKLV